MNIFLSSMLNALTSAYTRKDCANASNGLPMQTNIGKLFYLLAWGLEEANRQAEKIKLWDNLDFAEGAVLDRYGANFGVDRMGTDDTFYRFLIRTKMMAQLSGGDTDTILKTVSALLNISTSQIDFEDIENATIALFIDKSSIDDQYDRVFGLLPLIMEKILPAGVGIRLYIKNKTIFKYQQKIKSGVFCQTRVKTKRAD